MNNKVDVAVIGGGPGGTPAAMQLASRGKKVLLVEESGNLGGACLFVGCIPSKIIRHWAGEFDNERRMHTIKDDWTPAEREAAWNRIRGNMKEILQKRSGAAMQILNTLPTLTFKAGPARFTSSRELVVRNAADNREESFTFDQAIIATGARSFVPPFKGDAVNDLLTSEVFFSLEKLPESLLVVGGGPIGVELSQMLAKLGVKCTIIELLDSILSGVVEKEFLPSVGANLEKAGIETHTSSKVVEVNRSDNGYAVKYADKDGVEHTAEFEQVLVVTGKVPNIETLNLEAANIEHDRKGITVDGYLETTTKGIYATGDVIPGPKFAHTAAYEAQIAAMNILMGNNRKAAFFKNSWVLFSEPEIASCGLTEEQAAQKGYDVLTGVYDYKVDAAAQVMGNPFGRLKYVVDAGTMQVIGVHILQRDASSLIGEGALIVANKMTLQEVAQAIHPHPTLTEAYGTLALKMLSAKKQAS